MQLIIDGAEWLTSQHTEAIQAILEKDDGRSHIWDLETLRFTRDPDREPNGCEYAFESTPPRLSGEISTGGNVTYLESVA